MWNWFFGCNVFLDGFSKKLVSIWYQDLRSGYAHVKFQPDCSKGVDSTAIRRSETFATLAILYPHGWPSNFVCWNAWAPRSFWQIFIQRAQSGPKIWPKTRFSSFLSTKLKISIFMISLFEGLRRQKIVRETSWGHILMNKAHNWYQKSQWKPMEKSSHSLR